ncbi:MAG: hypothetical protein J0H62_11055, partial [Rhizobiales bacterium]|nr:hypothetical protein [Hyphomicrobiales bacterium]
MNDLMHTKLRRTSLLYAKNFWGTANGTARKFSPHLSLGNISVSARVRPIHHRGDGEAMRRVRGGDHRLYLAKFGRGLKPFAAVT